jgi:enterochelin esterase family protein
VGKANFILDNLIAEGKAVPMVVVMPLGYSKQYIDTPSGDILDWIRIATPLFENYFFNEVVSEAEKNYNVSKDPAQRAIAGLSMGGCQALYIGLKNPEKFAYVGGFSSVVKMYLHGALINNPAEINSKLKLLWIGCGKDDFLFGENKDFMAALDSKNIKFTRNISEGIHTWWVWREYLRDFSEKLFK